MERHVVVQGVGIPPPTLPPATSVRSRAEGSLRFANGVVPIAALLSAPPPDGNVTQQTQPARARANTQPRPQDDARAGKRTLPKGFVAVHKPGASNNNNPVLVCQRCAFCCSDPRQAASHAQQEGGTRQGRNAEAQARCDPVRGLCRWPGCGKTFKHPCKLALHARIHTKEKPHRCESCAATFARSGDLARHRRSHSNERRFRCATCGDTFGVSSSLKRHEQVHSGIKPYVCPEEGCNSAFIQKYDMTRHLRTHRNAQVFECDQPGCNKRFSGASSLAGHRERSHTAK